MPSATRNRLAVFSTRNESSLCCLCLPTCVSPSAFTSTRSALPEETESLSGVLRLALSLAQFRQRAQNFYVLLIPLQSLIEVAFRFGVESRFLAEQPGIFEVLRVHRLALHGHFDGLDGLTHHRRDSSRGDREIVMRFRILGIVFDRHVEVFVC